MTDPEVHRPLRARVTDLFRPAELYAGIDARPSFVVPVFLLVAGVMTYTQTAIGPVLPKILPSLLERSQSTESELVTAFRGMILVVSFLAPALFVTVTALGAWALARATAARPPLSLVFSLVAHASLWVALGFLVRAALVALTGNPEPSTNLGFFLRPEGTAARITAAFTNPFLILAGVWTARGLRSWGAGPAGAWIAGGVPWAAWIVGLSLLGGGSGSRFAPTGPVSYDDWGVVEKEHVQLRYAPESRKTADETAQILDGFVRQLTEKLDLEPHPIRVLLYRDHAQLERATGEFLHVRVTGSIRGRDLLYLETPGRSAAMPREQGLRDALRYVALLQLAPATRGAPRWFVEGFAHAATIPHSPVLEKSYREALERVGVPSIEMLFDPLVFRTPEGPVLARSLVDHIAFLHGRPTVETVLRDVAGGTPFRDALFARTRLTTSALEVGWQTTIRDLLGGAAGDSVAADSTAVPEPLLEVDGEGDVQPFLDRH